MRKLNRVKTCVFVDGDNKFTVEGVLSEVELGTLVGRIGTYVDTCRERRGADKQRIENERADLEKRLAELG